MEKTRTLKSTIYSALAVMCAIMVAFMFTACANIADLLKQEATYNKDVIYTEAVDAAESQAVISYITDRIHVTSSGLTKFELMSDFRYTAKTVSKTGEQLLYVNAVAAKKQLAGDSIIKNAAQKEETYFYEKDNVVYLDQINPSGEHQKEKMSNKDDAYLYSISSMVVLASFIHTDLTTWTSVKKSGKNYRFERDGIKMFVQFDSSSRLMALAFIKVTEEDAVTEVFSVFEGSLSFPSLDGYTEDD